MKKAALRKLFLGKRADLTPEQTLEMSLQMSAKLISGVDFKNIRLLHYFISIRKKNEVDTSVIIARIKAKHPAIVGVVPRVDQAAGQLEHLEVTPNTAFRDSDLGIPEPVGGSPVHAESIDLVLVPLLCFDERGNRVGYGGGYYDRFLARCRPDCLKIGLSFFGPVDEIEDIHEGDVGLDFCVTPDEVYDLSLTIDH